MKATQCFQDKYNQVVQMHVHKIDYQLYSILTASKMAFSYFSQMVQWQYLGG